MLPGGLDIVRREETERDGHAFSGPEHGHTVDIPARKPNQQAAIGTGVPLAPFPGVADVLHAAEETSGRP